MQWTLKILEKDEDGVAFYLTHYRPFRLLALETDPSGESAKEREAVLAACWPAADLEWFHFETFANAKTSWLSAAFGSNLARELAFDEATGRLCVGLYNGLLYILDYV